MKRIIIVSLLFLSMIHIDASVKPTVSQKKSYAPKKPATQEQRKMIQDFVQTVQDILAKNSDQKNYNEKTQKMFAAYEEISKIPKNISLTQAELEGLQKAAQKLFDNKISHKNNLSTSNNSAPKK